MLRFVLITHSSSQDEALIAQPASGADSAVWHVAFLAFLVAECVYLSIAFLAFAAKLGTDDERILPADSIHIASSGIGNGIEYLCDPLGNVEDQLLRLGLSQLYLIQLVILEGDCACHRHGCCNS